jgi:hypothetical protein
MQNLQPECSWTFNEPPYRTRADDLATRAKWRYNQWGFARLSYKFAVCCFLCAGTSYLGQATRVTGNKVACSVVVLDITRIDVITPMLPSVK